jgi:ring-1,2-phenylacetyl-CoA epoxidase subunit PaaD
MVDVTQQIWEILHLVEDPEIPYLNVVEMGIVRAVNVGEILEVVITPTYSGCPAMKTIEEDIKEALAENGFPHALVKTVLAPAWTTDWISESGRKKMKDYGIAPPMDASMDKRALLHGERIVKCTRCGSTNTKLISQFGSTACKALFQCQDCHEPFDYFKCL